MSAAVADAIERLDALAAEQGVELRADVPLAPLTTLRVGGSADRLAAPATVDELVTVIPLCTARPVSPRSCSARAVTSSSRMPASAASSSVSRRRATIDGTMLIADAGASMTALAKRCADAGLAGFDWAISIPGSVGGAVWANAGAHGGEMSQVVRGRGPRRRRRARAPPPDESAFAYRESRFKHGDEIILGATIGLERGEPAAIRALVNAHQALRRATQPLADQNAGSVFRNPPGDHAGRLVEAAGLKGHRLGSARSATLHANFIVTDRGGRAADVRALGDHVRATVADRFGVELRYEIEFVGDWPEPTMSRLRVGIFAGGRSAEHEVSVASAESVLRAIDRDRFEPYLVYIDREGRWMLPGPGTAAGDGTSLAGLVGAASPSEEVARLRTTPTTRWPSPRATTISPRGRRSAPWRSRSTSPSSSCHDPYGEDGTSRASSSWQASRTPARACSRARWRWTRSSSRTSCAVTGFRWSSRAGSAAAPGTRSPTTSCAPWPGTLGNGSS